MVEPMSDRRRVLCMIALLSATLLAALDTTIANTALPRIAADLHASDAAIIWVANAYQIAMVAGLLPLAALGESIGYRTVFIAGLVTFALASVLCGAAPTLDVLVAGRALKGAGAAALMSVITAFIRHIHPADRLGHGIGLNALVVAIGFTLGPVIASTILSVADWHWLFFINVPVALVSLVLSVRHLPDAAGGRHRFDAVSAALCAAFLGLLTFGLCSAENGAGLPAALAAVGVALACLVLLLRRQKDHAAPMLALDLLRIRPVRLSSLTSICAFMTQALALVALPFLLQHTQHVSQVETGFLIAAWPFMVALMALVVAPLSDRGRIPAGALCGAGLLVLAAGMAALAAMPADTGEARIALLLALCGAGFGLFQTPNMREIMSRSPTARSGGASGIVAVSRLLGQTCGSALVAQCFHAWQATGPVMALWLGSGCALAGAVFSVLRLRGATKASP